MPRSRCERPVNSRTRKSFWRHYTKLPRSVQGRAKAAYQQFVLDPSHPRYLNALGRERAASQSCWARQLHVSSVDFRMPAVLLGTQYGFPRLRFGLAWEPASIQARSLSKPAAQARDRMTRHRLRPPRSWPGVMRRCFFRNVVMYDTEPKPQAWATCFMGSAKRTALPFLQAACYDHSSHTGTANSPSPKPTVTSPS